MKGVFTYMAGSKKRGLAIIYDPNSLRQFIWYYATISKDIVWDALCFPYGGNNIHMEGYCEKTEIFSQIYTGEDDYFNMPLLTKGMLFFKLCFFFILKRQDIVTKKILNAYVDDIDKYNIYLANTDTGFISGLLARLGKDKEVIYMEDGAFDYKKRSKWKCNFKTFSFEYWQGFFMSRMGYCSKGRFYFELTKDCTKYCTSEKNMRYRNYKEIVEFGQMNREDSLALYSEILERLYPELKGYDFGVSDFVFFTFPMEDLTDKSQKYIEKIEGYISKNHKKIMLKRHPRDTHIYKFTGCESIEIDQKIPGEVVLPYIKGKNVAFTIPCSIMLSMSDTEYDMELLFFDELAQGADRSVIRKYSTIEELGEELKDVNCERVNIVHL